MAKVLEQDYDLILIDARGHGLSDHAGTAFTSQLLTKDAVGVIVALKLDRPHLLGFSLGAETAARLAATHPGLVRTVIVAGADDQAPQPQSFVNSPGSGMVPVVCGLPQGTQNPDARGAHGLLTALASPWRAAVA